MSLAVTWRSDWSDDPASIRALYRGVFDEELSEEELAPEAGVVHLQRVVREADGVVAGFGLYRGSGSDVELRHAGVLPAHRRQGAGTFLLEAAERELAERGYGRLNVSTHNRWNIMLSMLVRRGYRVERTEYCARRADLTISLYRPLRQRKELRLALTGRCNFKCFFCHNEGLPGGAEEPSPLARTLEVLEQAIALGHTDITLTGGEPLLEKERLRALCAALSRRAERPELTLVTNGFLLDEEVVGWLRGHPLTKLHVSLHASDRESFARVTGVGPDAFDRVRENIARATRAGLTVKINHVVLQGINHRPEQLHRTIALARELGASALKLIELLVVSENAEDFRWFYDVGALRRHLEPVATGPVRESRRKEVYRHRDDARFAIEVERCTCRLGCANCRELRDRTSPARVPPVLRPDEPFLPGRVRRGSGPRVQRGRPRDRWLREPIRELEPDAATSGALRPGLHERLLHRR